METIQSPSLVQKKLRQMHWGKLQIAPVGFLCNSMIPIDEHIDDALVTEK